MKLTIFFLFFSLSCFAQEKLIARMDLMLDEKTGETSIIYHGKCPSYFVKQTIDSIYGTQVDDVTLKQCEKYQSFIREISVKHLSKKTDAAKLEEF